MQTVFIGSTLPCTTQAVLPADVLARYYRQNGHKVLFVTSSTCPGQQPESAGLDLLDLVPDQLADPEDLATKELVQGLFGELQQKGLVYQQPGSGQYFFRLADFSARLHELLDWSGGGFDPATRAEAKNKLQAGLTDLPVAERTGGLSPVFSQLAGFLAASLAWAKKSGHDWQPYWTLPARSVYVGSPVDRQGLALFWPALLGAFNPALKLPDQIMTGGLGQKVKAVEEGFPVDSLRYFFLKDSPEDMKTLHNKDLAGSLSSFILRVYQFLIEHHFGCTPNEPCEPKIRSLISQTYTDCGQLLAAGSFDQALASIFHLLDRLDQFFTEQDPAALMQHDPDMCDQTLATCLDGIVNLSQLLAPFLPGFAQKIRLRLGLAEKPGWDFASCPGGILLKNPEPAFLPKA